MSDVVFSILIAGIETLLLPAILRWLKKHVSRRWLVYVLLVVIVLMMTMVLGTAVSVLSYYFSKS
ncbi:MAG: hypothetical protein K2H38_06750 [Muribaculaceae bacterium]|nr:hypothetical protein [Muribaculaceae bacterium]MDE6553186.1 hypothetical protein [Muribaculaceae bacterium]